MLKVLTPADRVALNEASGTDASSGGSALPMQDVVDKAAIDRAIDTMNPVDPLSAKPALTAAYNVLQHTNAGITHIIVLGDGDAEDSYYPLVTQIHKAGITISTVATGGETPGFLLATWLMYFLRIRYMLPGRCTVPHLCTTLVDASVVRSLPWML